MRCIKKKFFVNLLLFAMIFGVAYSQNVRHLYADSDNLNDLEDDIDEDDIDDIVDASDEAGASDEADLSKVSSVADADADIDEDIDLDDDSDLDVGAPTGVESNMNFWVVVMTISLLGCVGLLLIIKRKKTNG